VTLVPAQTGLTGARTQYSNPLYVLMLAVGIILLMLAPTLRADTRSCRRPAKGNWRCDSALGAGRARVVRQLLTEA